MEDLKKLEQNLIDSMKAQQEAIDDATESALLYDEELAAVMKLNPRLAKLMEERDTAQGLAKVHKDHYAETKANAVKQLLEVTDPEDIKVVDAFGYQMKKVAKLPPNDELVAALVKANAFGLLKPDTKQINKFVVDCAFKEDDNYVMPEWVLLQYNWAIDVESEIKPTISDAKITKLATADGDVVEISITKMR